LSRFVTKLSVKIFVDLPLPPLHTISSGLRTEPMKISEASLGWSSFSWLDAALRTYHCQNRLLRLPVGRIETSK
jgi:hypothetical protein